MSTALEAADGVRNLIKTFDGLKAIVGELQRVGTVEQAVAEGTRELEKTRAELATARDELATAKAEAKRVRADADEYSKSSKANAERTGGRIVSEATEAVRRDEVERASHTALLEGERAAQQARADALAAEVDRLTVLVAGLRAEREDAARVAEAQRKAAVAALGGVIDVKPS